VNRNGPVPDEIRQRPIPAVFVGAKSGDLILADFAFKAGTRLREQYMFEPERFANLPADSHIFIGARRRVKDGQTRRVPVRLANGEQDEARVAPAAQQSDEND